MKPAVQDWSDPAAVAEWLATSSCGGNPNRRAQLDMLVALVAELQPKGTRILDLGCGDGMVSEMLLNRLPGSSVVGVDMSVPMLEAAEKRLRAYPGRYKLFRRSMADLSPLAGEATFDAAIGVQSIHHLDGIGKRALFGWVADQLRPGGLFLLSDRVRLPSAELFPYHLLLYNRQQAAAGGKELPADYGYAAHRRSLELRADLPDTVEDQLIWLREASFGEADCFYRYVERAIFGGLKLPPSKLDQPAPSDHSASLVNAENAVGSLL
ncbi:MAG: class I SAM-dependent methyltransferase [Chloroflexia bacterium]